jgi:phospholipase C
VDLRSSSSWYDVSMVSDRDSTFVRRFAGHIETGAIGVSDPAVITG